MGFALKKVEYLFNAEEYLKFERAAETRHEYLDGRIYAMAGESDEHGIVSANLSAIFVSQLKGTECQARVKDKKVRSGVLKKTIFPPKGMFSYPDLVVICGKVQHHDDFNDVVTNPKVIVEVLSNSTAKFDREIKFQRYQKNNETLTDYLLVSQDAPRVEHYIRQASGGWLYFIYENLETEFSIDSINCRVNLADVFDRVDFFEDEGEVINFSVEN